MKPNTLVLAVLSLVSLTGCQGTRLVQSVGASAQGTYDPATGVYDGSIGGTITFRDGRDPKTINKPTIR